MLSNRESATHCVALPDDKGGETDTHNMALKPVRAAGPIQVVAARYELNTLQIRVKLIHVQ